MHLHPKKKKKKATRKEEGEKKSETDTNINVWMRVDKDHGQTISELRRGVHVQIALQQAANLEGGLVVEFVCSPASLQPTPTLCYPRVSVISEHVTN
jgi:hypothetical protein